VALLNGDPTARMLGRITLNPVPHIDMVGSILVPGLLLLSGSSFLIGWAKPVPVNPLNFRNYRWGEFAVSAAGPLSNLVLAAIFSVVLRLGVENPGLSQLASYGVMINILLALFNLIPIPPLDGSHIMALVLPRELARLYGHLQPVGMVIIIILMFTGILWKILLPLVKQVALIMLG
jgi:Zn-dependent protease